MPTLLSLFDEAEGEDEAEAAAANGCVGNWLKKDMALRFVGSDDVDPMSKDKPRARTHALCRRRINRTEQF